MERQYVGIDFHRRRSVIVRLNAAGERLAVTRVANDPLSISAAVAEAGPEPEVVIEATYGWYWIVDLLQANGATVHLANPNALNWGERRVKNDVIDATDLADMLRLNRLPEAWIAPPGIRELRELVRYRAKLVQLRSGLKAQVHAVMAKEGVLPIVSDMFCAAGNAQLDAMELAPNYALRVESLRDLIALYDREVAMLERDIHRPSPPGLWGGAGHQRHRAHHRRGVGGRDWRGGALSQPRGAVLVGGTHPQTPRVRRQDPSRRDHQAGLASGALVLDRGHRPLPRRANPCQDVLPHRQATRRQQGARRHRAQGPHARLLRPARRRDPLPGAGGGGVRLGHDQTARSTSGMTLEYVDGSIN